MFLVFLLYGTVWTGCMTAVPTSTSTWPSFTLPTSQSVSGRKTRQRWYWETTFCHLWKLWKVNLYHRSVIKGLQSYTTDFSCLHVIHGLSLAGCHWIHFMPCLCTLILLCHDNVMKRFLLEKEVKQHKNSSAVYNISKTHLDLERLFESGFGLFVKHFLK